MMLIYASMEGGYAAVTKGLRYGWIYNDHFVENFVLNVAIKEF